MLTGFEFANRLQMGPCGQQGGLVCGNHRTGQYLRLSMVGRAER